MLKPSIPTSTVITDLENSVMAGVKAGVSGGVNAGVSAGVGRAFSE